MGSLKACHSRTLTGITVKGRQPLLCTECLIRAVGTVGRPVVVCLEIQILVLARCKQFAQVDDSCALADLGKDLIQHGIFVHHRRTGRQFFGVDDAGRWSQQEGHLAGVIGSKLTDSRDVFVQLLFRCIVHCEQLCKHPAVLAQQDTALLSLAEENLVCGTLGVDRRITEGELILHPAGKAALPASVQQCTDAECGKLCSLAVFQHKLLPLGPQHIHSRKAKQQHSAEDEQRKAHAAPAAALAVYDL